MYRLFRLFSRSGTTRKLFRVFLIAWLTTTFSVFFMKNRYIGQPKTHRTGSALVNGSVYNQKDTAPDTIHAAHIPLNNSEKYSGGKMGSLMGFIAKANTDKSFLNWLLDQQFLHKSSKEILQSYLTGSAYTGFDSQLKRADEIKLKQTYDFNTDVIVFLHIQKTGGTRLNDRFLKDLRLPIKCTCSRKLPCSCRSSNGNVWLYTMVFAGWPCGLHADWTQLHRCIPERIDKMEGKHRQRRYFYFTQLREPIQRYISEWRHQHSKNHWQDAILGCGDGYSDWADVRPCFHGANWKGVTLDDFTGCPHNLATNRQTRMLADLTRTNCYRNFAYNDAKLKRAVGWVDSAIENLMSMEFFGLMEEVAISDELLGKAYGIKFSKGSVLSQSETSTAKITDKQFKKILGLVELDIHVYVFAKQLLMRRYGKSKDLRLTL